MYYAYKDISFQQNAKDLLYNYYFFWKEKLLQYSYPCQNCHVASLFDKRKIMFGTDVILGSTRLEQFQALRMCAHKWWPVELDFILTSFQLSCH